MSEADADGGRVALAPPPAAASISVHGLTKRHGEVEAVRGIDVDVAAGDRKSVV